MGFMYSWSDFEDWAHFKESFNNKVAVCYNFLEKKNLDNS